MHKPLLEKRATPLHWIAFSACFPALLMACGLFTDSADRHRENAEAYLREGRNQEALIEFYQATRLKPDDLELNLRAAEVFAQSGHYMEAADFYKDALSIRPDDPETSLRLGEILVQTDPSAAEAMSEQMLEANPESAQAWLLKARLALHQNKLDSARSLIKEAEKRSPYEPEVNWLLAETEEAIDRNAKLKNPLARVSPNQLGRIASNYQSYLNKGGTRRLEAELRRAKALSRAMGNRRQQARQIYESLLTQSLDDSPRPEQIAAFNQMMEFAIRDQDAEMAQEILKQWISAAPQDLQAWTYQASLYQGASEEDRDAAYQQILENAEGNLAMQVIYAEHLSAKLGPESGLAYLQDGLTGDDTDAARLAEILNLQHRDMRLRDAEATLRKYRTEFPEDPRIPQLAARHALLTQNYVGAVRTISELPEHAKGTLEYQISANALMKQGLNAEALEQINRAMATAREPNPATLRLKAQIEFNLREYRRAAASLIQLRSVSPLSTQEEIMLARSYYASRAPGVGRKMLMRVLGQDPGQPAIALELHRQERENSNRPEVVYQALSDALSREPQNMKVLEALTESDLKAGRTNSAMARVNQIIEPSNWLGPPYLVRARIHLSQGRLKDARNDAERARLLTPRVAEQSYEIQALAYLASADPSRPIAMLEEAAEAGKLTADRTALLARLKMHSGQPERAIELYERALQAGSKLHHVKNDLALLLAEQGRDLERAEQLAQLAVDSPGEQIDANDTLGFVYLKQGKAGVAYWKFRYVIDNASTPRAEYHYHLALALIEMGRAEEAREELDVALEIDPLFGPAQELRDTLGGESSAQAS